MPVSNDFIAGTGSGMISKIIEYPFDTVKVRLQTEPQKFRSPFACFVVSFKRDGLQGLYRGVGMPMLASMAENAILFSSYSKMQQLLLRGEQREQTMSEVFVSGCAAGLAVSTLLTPVELIKCRLQMSTSAYKGTLDCIARTVMQEGLLAGLFKGHTSTVAREIPGTSAWFCTYEAMCKVLSSEGQSKQDLPMSRIMLSGGTAGVMYWMAFFPADVVKSRIQTGQVNLNIADSLGRQIAVKPSFTQVLLHIARTEGVRGLYRGAGTSVVRAFPAHASIFYTYECIMGQLR